MEPSNFEYEVKSLAVDLKNRIQQYIDNTGHTHDPEISIQYTRQQDIIGESQKHGVFVKVTGSIVEVAEDD